VRVYPVSQILAYLRDVVAMDESLQSIWIEGEISGFRQTAAGHCYFTLKDGAAQMTCAWFVRHIPRNLPLPRDGQQVLVHGRVEVYEARGALQLIARAVRAAGTGLDIRRLEELRARLAEQGLFAPSRKRALPRFPRRVGLVTSPDGAAHRDIETVIRRRYPAAEIIFSPATVQGDDAPAQIVRALERLDSVPELDVIIVSRGGGAVEDLSAFNDESVAWAIFWATVPVISGIGHEVDYTIADLVADHRAATPSVAAEMAVPDREALLAEISYLARRLSAVTRVTVDTAGRRVRDRVAHLERRSPLRIIAAQRLRCHEMRDRTGRSMEMRLARSRLELTNVRGRLEALGPRQVLTRGFSIVTDAASGRTVRRPQDTGPGRDLVIRLGQGAIRARTLDETAWKIDSE